MKILLRDIKTKVQNVHHENGNYFVLTPKVYTASFFNDFLNFLLPLQTFLAQFLCTQTNSLMLQSFIETLIHESCAAQPFVDVDHETGTLCIFYGNLLPKHTRKKLKR